MTDKPDFDALRRARGERLEQIVDEFCEERGWDRSKVLFHASGADGCYCACPDGPCEHEFDGWREFEDGRGGEQVCRKCGMGAMGHSLRFLP